MKVRRTRACASCFFVHSEKQPDILYTFGAQLFGGNNLRRYDSLRVARTAPVNIIFVFARRDVRRHGIHVRREKDVRRITSRRDDVGAILRYLLRFDTVAQTFEIRTEKTPHGHLFACDGRNIYQRSC